MIGTNTRPLSAPFLFLVFARYLQLVTMEFRKEAVLLANGSDVALYGLRLFLQILLLAIFHNFFGLRAIGKYHKKEVYLVNTLRNTEGIPLPANNSHVC